MFVPKFHISFRAITEMHSQDKNGVQGRIFKSSLMMLQTLLICQVVLKSTSFFFFFLPPHLPAIELIPEGWRKGLQLVQKCTNLMKYLFKSFVSFFISWKWDLRKRQEPLGCVYLHRAVWGANKSQTGVTKWVVRESLSWLLGGSCARALGRSRQPECSRPPLSQRSAWHSLSQRRACGPHSLAARWCSGFLLRARKTHIRPSPSPQEEISRSWSWCTLLLGCKFLVASQGWFSEGFFFSRGSSMLLSSDKSQQCDPASPPPPAQLLTSPTSRSPGDAIQWTERELLRSIDFWLRNKAKPDLGFWAIQCCWASVDPSEKQQLLL